MPAGVYWRKAFGHFFRRDHAVDGTYTATNGIATEAEEEVRAMGAHILAGAAAFGLMAAPIAAVRIGQWRDAQAERAAALAAMLARIEVPRLDADEAQAAFAAIRAEAVRLMEASGTRLDIRLDRWDTPHYHTEPIASERTTVLHLVDTQPHSAVTATRPMLPTVTRGELKPARLWWDMGRAV